MKEESGEKEPQTCCLLISQSKFRDYDLITAWLRLDLHFYCKEKLNTRIWQKKQIDIIEIFLLKVTQNQWTPESEGGFHSRFQRIKAEFLYVRDLRTVTLNLNIYKSIPLSDPIIFALAWGLLTSKVKEYVPNMSFWVCVCVCVCVFL